MNNSYYEDAVSAQEILPEQFATIRGGEFSPAVLTGAVAGVAIQVTTGVGFPLVNQAIDQLWQPLTQDQALFKEALLDPHWGFNNVL